MKDLELKMNDMQKNVVSESNKDANTNINIAPNKTESPSSNPFVDTFREMNENQTNSGLDDIFKMFLAGEGKMPEGESGNTKNLYDILGKLSDNKESPGDQPDKAKLESLFGDLLEFLLKSDMLAEPLTQIKNSVNSYLEKNKDKLKPEEEEKYTSMLVSIDTIMCEIQKKEPNKALVIEIFYKLHELSDIDSDILPQGDSTFKQFTDLFGNKN